MRHLKSLLTASVLIVSISATTFAGSITTLRSSATGSITTLSQGSITTLRTGSITTLSTPESSSVSSGILLDELRNSFSMFFIALW